jgi:hypothetical protein
VQSGYFRGLLPGSDRRESLQSTTEYYFSLQSGGVSTIITHLEHNNVLSELQHGFRKKRSTDNQLILSVQDLAADLDKGQQIDAVLLDFSKAFDKVPHRKASALGDARSHFTLCRVFTFENYFLGATGEIVCNPRQSITSHSRVVEFQEKTSMGNFIEGL